MTTPIGATGSAFAVNSANPVKSLTKAQLKSILTGAVTDWAAVGGAAGPIRVVLREPTSQTRSGLEAYVFEKGEKIVYSASALDHVFEHRVDRDERRTEVVHRRDRDGDDQLVDLE